MKLKLLMQNWASYSPKAVGFLLAVFYVLLTLLNNSNSLVISWPWVLVWHIGLLISCAWWLLLVWRDKRIQLLGNGLDWLVLFLIIGLIISTLNAEFVHQSCVNLVAVISYLTALYGLNQWLENKDNDNNNFLKVEKLLTAIGYLTLSFIVISLYLWLTVTIIPEIARLQELGEQVIINFDDISIRNKFPIGHQNYLAGYLILTLPLLIALSYLKTGFKRGLWIISIVLSLITLYSTASRGGWLGLLGISILAAIYWLLWSDLPRKVIILGQGLGVVILTILVLANNRLLKLFSAAFSGDEGGEFAYRLIMLATSWRMGSTHPLSGVGLGGVPLNYQNYRPAWAGREAEITFQLHSTVAQLWAELGLWGIVTFFATVALLIYLVIRYLHIIDQNSYLFNSTEVIFIVSLDGGLFSYSILSLTDYQLDNVAISGTLVIFLAVIANHFRQVLVSPEQKANLSILNQNSQVKKVVLVGLGLLIAISIWSTPILKAWQLSSQGFTALKKGDITGFVQSFNQSRQLASWNSFYAYILGWKLADFSMQILSSPEQQQLRTDSLYWFDQAIKNSPYYDYGYTSSAWLLWQNQNYQAASQDFAQATRLLPAKTGLFYWLGLSLLQQGKQELAINSMVLELLRHPIMITSPIWQVPELKNLYPQIIAKVDEKYSQFLQSNVNSEKLTRYLHYNRGILRWWQGDLTAAKEDLANYGTPLSQILLDIQNQSDIDAQLKQLPVSPATLIINAWLKPPQRTQLLQQAWLMGFSQPVNWEKIQQLEDMMANTSSLQTWLQTVPLWQQMRVIYLGFGVFMRHVDGPDPVELISLTDNLAVKRFFADLLADVKYFPDLDAILQPERDLLYKSLD
jgi:O-antigen ligase